MSFFSTKATTCSILGIIGGGIAGMFGGWDKGLITLLTLMVIDYITGLLVATVFKKSPKTKRGCCSSAEGFKGLVRKGTMLAFVLIGYLLDQYTGSSFIRDAVIIGFVTNELISTVENAGLMGIPLPPVVADAIELLKHKEKERE